MDLLLIVLPAFLIFGAGFIGQKLLKLDIKSISTMSLYLMLPFLTFDTFYSNQLNIEYFYMFLFTFLLAVILIILTVLYGIFIKANKTQMSAMLLGTIFPNSGNYGAPVAMFAFGATGFQYAVIFMVIHAFLINTIGIFIASYGSEKTTSMKDSVMRVLKMPVLYGFLFGVVFQQLHIELPSTIRDGISLVGSASIPTVMLILGMQLAEIKPQKFELKYVNSVTIFRMLVSPLLAVVLVSFMPVNDLIKNVYILLAAMPIAANTTLLAVQFNVKPDLTSFTTLVTTLLSLVTIPLTLFLIK
ncbi:AEC family transporter [Niallia sp. XMNu-256]|uniref:AEC family transporter n=1 Tax=Niallia sp. XMNu-256 TaxID=3082444 RepID=UPI0030CF159A